MVGFKQKSTRWIFIILIAVLFFMVLILNSSVAEYFVLSSQHDEMQVRIENLKSTQEALQTQIAYARSDKAVEEWARTYERMIQPGDQVIVPLKMSNQIQELNYLPTQEANTNQNWQIWWDLFFSD